MKKRWITLALAAAMLCGVLGGCVSGTAGSSAAGGSSAADSQEAVEAKGVKISILSSASDLRVDQTNPEFLRDTGYEIDVTVIGVGSSPYEAIASRYSAGNPPTVAILDTTDIVTLKDKALDLSDQKWAQEGEGVTTKIDGKIISFPLDIGGRGFIYNKTAIEETLGEDFDPASIKNSSDFKAVLDKLRAAGMENPFVISKEDWSLGAHYLQLVYESQGEGTSADIEAFLEELKAGSVDLITNDRFNQYMDTFDLIKQYNINGKDPLAADYSIDPTFLVDNEAAFWFNGTWAWGEMYTDNGNQDDSNEYGILPAFTSAADDDFVNTSLQAAITKQCMVDNVKATAEEQEAAKAFFNWLTYEAAGQNALVNYMSNTSPFKANTLQNKNQLSNSVKTYINEGKTFDSAIVPADHWTILGASMQQYLADKMSRAELATAIQDYWKKQA